MINIFAQTRRLLEGSVGDWGIARDSDTHLCPFGVLLLRSLESRKLACFDRECLLSGCSTDCSTFRDLSICGWGTIQTEFGGTFISFITGEFHYMERSCLKVREEEHTIRNVQALKQQRSHGMRRDRY